MTSVLFKPWIGKNYQHGYWGKRVMLLGESHYIHPSDVPKDTALLTIAVVRKQFEVGGESYPFFTRITKTFTGEGELTRDDKEAFWERVSFYNYVQESAGPAARIAPTLDMWQLSEEAFFEVIEELKPEIIIAFGYRLFAHMPTEGGKEGPPISQGKQTRTWIYDVDSNGRTALTYNVIHPSSGRYSSSEWHPCVKEAITGSIETAVLTDVPLAIHE